MRNNVGEKKTSIIDASETDAAVLFHALGDTTRLQIIKHLLHSGLVNKGAQTIITLSERSSMSRQAMRKHLKILEESEIIELQPRGRDTTVWLMPKAIEKIEKLIANLARQTREMLPNRH